MESWQNALKLYASQISKEMNHTQMYVYSLPANILYSDLGQPRGSSRYEFAKTNLARQVQQSELLGTGLADGLYIRIRQTGEVIAYRNSAVVGDEENAGLLEASAGWENAPWHIEEVKGREYLIRTIIHQRTASSIVIKKESILAQWTAQSGDFMAELRDDFPSRRGYLLLMQPLTSGNATSVGIYISFRRLAGDMKWYYLMLLSMASIAAVMIALLTRMFRRRMILPLKKMEETLQRISDGSTQERMIRDQSVQELYSLAGTFNSMMDHIYRLRIQTYELEIENERSRLINLQQQIKPHLLLNSLNTVYALAEVGDLQTIQTFVMNLVGYFRYSLKITEELALLRNELDFIQNYVKIQQIRYPNRFYLLYDVEENLMDYPVLPLLIQNFVENSIKYSLCEHEVEIIVGVRLDEDKLRISVTDNGKGMKPEILQQIQTGDPIVKEGEQHIGIWNCRNRMRLYYGDRAQLTVCSAPDEGTAVWICIPSHGIREEQLKKAGEKR